MLGIDFAHQTLGELINEIIDKQVRIELDDMHQSEIPIDNETNQKLLIDYSQKFFDAILGSISSIPLQFLNIANYLTKQVKKRFQDPDAIQAAIAGFIFLRFFWYVRRNIYLSVKSLSI